MSLGVLLIIYVITDFYFINQQKSNDFIFKKVIIHSLIYLTLLLLTLIYNCNIILFIIVVLLGINHFLIHLFIFFIKRIINNNIILFLLEHFLHIITIILSIKYLRENNEILLAEDTIYIKIILSLLLLAIPGNIIFKKLFIQFKPKDDNTLTTFKNAGAIIGTLERYLMFICLVNSLYTSIGLVFTAKSIARYKRINDEPAFSEYYLIGTLSSLLYTIIIYLIIFV